jgi:D-3-phosphoglycerate dehydrogenase
MTSPTSIWSCSLFRDAGMEALVAHCRTEEDVIAAAEGCQGLLVQYAPVNAKVLDGRPRDPHREPHGRGLRHDRRGGRPARGVWVSNSPDYGVAEVATHALAMALSLVRHIPEFDRDIRAGRWHYSSTGP